MSALEQVIKWSQGLPGWQADAVRRLLEQGTLTPDDRDVVFGMLKAAHGIGSTDKEPIFPQLGGFSGTSHSALPITLERILDIRHVNAIQNGSSLPFALSGLTVIYGQNGSGKSSYARILKRACRARDSREAIHPNVFDPAEIGPATAIIRISEGAQRGIELLWTDGRDADRRLAQVSVFDSKCARVIVDENNEAVYIPYGCHAFDGLVELAKEFRARLQTERPTPAEPQAPTVIQGTSSHEFLRQLSRHTTAEAIDGATAWLPLDEEALAHTEARIAQSTSRESSVKARRLRLTARRTGELSSELEAAYALLGASNIVILNGQISAYLAAGRAATLAAHSALTHEPLPAGASNEWRLLYEAARNYSLRVAYEGTEFPVTGDGALCVLCQQPLCPDAISRMQRFRIFMENQAEQELQRATTTLDQSTKRVASHPLPNSEAFSSVLEELRDADRQAVQAAITWLITERIRAVHALEAREPLGALQPPNIGDVLKSLQGNLEAQALQAEQDANPAALQALERQRNELRSRRALSQLKAALTRYVADSQRAFAYEQCTNTLGTRGISDRSKEIISAALSPQLRSDLQDELNRLGASHLRLSVNITGREGGARHQLALSGPVRRAKLSEILSEGEHCVVGVAGFLAELGGAPGVSPIVLDDPVSSLDHRYSRYIARRLVDEAKRRQVVVFTHNIAFLVELENLSAGVGLAVRTVQRAGGTAGVCIEGVPWEAMTVRERLSHLDERIVKLQLLHGKDEAAYNRDAAFTYDLLRQTWEAAIERELLNETVRRHDIDVQTQRLMQVEVADSDCVLIESEMSKCSGWIGGHDKSIALDANRPSPKELRLDVQTLRNFVREINARRENVRVRRKGLLRPLDPLMG
jgi:energy-coupling factor transporter ATP-binding protein EcfA2